MDICKLLEKEKSGGYLDSSVFGGFASFMLSWAEQNKLPQLTEIIGKYAEASLAERPALLLQMQQQLAACDKSIIAVKESGTSESTGNTGSSLNIPLVSLKNIGKKRAELFKKLGANTAGELLEIFPRDYQDRRELTPIGQLLVGQQANIRGRVIASELQRAANGRMTILRCYLKDDSGMIPVIWFNQPFLQKKFYEGRELIVYGNVEIRGRNTGLQLTARDYQTADEAKTDSMGIVPVYSCSEGLSNKMINLAMENAWRICANDISDLLPEILLKKRKLLPRKEAMEKIHFPDEISDIDQARRSLSYEELLAIQLAILVNKPTQKKEKPAAPVISDEEVLRRYLAILPFTLTAAQERVIREIFADMNSPYPMSRLVQGDVGCGKTAIAAAAIAKCCLNGSQAAMMAPTEILAKQHYANLLPLFSKLSLKTVLLTSSTPQSEKKAILADLANGLADVAIGTHSLIQEQVAFNDLGLAITDEQHRFGVAQRASLRGKSNTDTLVMTATPIPRTLAMTIYADMSLSVIDQLPPGRKPVHTYAVDYSYEERIHRFMAGEIAKGRQAFVVCPLIEDNEDLDLASVNSYHKRLQKEVFPFLKIGLLHGKMKADEKEAVMARFKAAEYDILVATTVIEVGIDIPNATIMVVRDAERFGLAQLHQLRGRIGRGKEEGYCILLHNKTGEIAKERLKTLCNCHDGFSLAEADLKLRGPGEFFGKRQHGMASLHIADVFRDSDLLEASHEDALEILKGNIPYPAPLASMVNKKKQALI